MIAQIRLGQGKSKIKRNYISGKRSSQKQQCHWRYIDPFASFKIHNPKLYRIYHIKSETGTNVTILQSNYIYIFLAMLFLSIQDILFQREIATHKQTRTHGEFRDFIDVYLTEMEQSKSIISCFDGIECFNNN